MSELYDTQNNMKQGRTSYYPTVDRYSTSDLTSNHNCRDKRKFTGWQAKRRIGICMATDFFYPYIGGVELHVYCISKELVRCGFRVVVVTHCQPLHGRHGVRYLSGGIKVYYLPEIAAIDNVTFPYLFGCTVLVRKILIRERIDIVHAHQILSLLLCDVDHYICVSYTNRENLVLRCGFVPTSGSVIPNAIDMLAFTPNLSCRPTHPQINIVVVSRLAYRKGVDLLIEVIPELCRRVSNAYFIIVGDGPMSVSLEEMRENNSIQDRVEMIGSLPHSAIPDVLQRGHVFLNASLTEAFGTAIIEAASCGLMVVATDVGGVPEVLPAHIMKLAQPDPHSIITQVLAALDELNDFDPWKAHQEVSNMYSWEDVAERTEKVYRHVIGTPIPKYTGWIYRIYMAGRLSGILIVLICAIEIAVHFLLDLLQPRRRIQTAPPWPPEELRSRKKVSLKERENGVDILH